jgi:hypothetical protein
MKVKVSSPVTLCCRTHFACKQSFNLLEFNTVMLKGLKAQRKLIYLPSMTASEFRVYGEGVLV